MKSKIKRIATVILTLAIVCSSMIVPAFAAKTATKTFTKRAESHTVTVRTGKVWPWTKTVVKFKKLPGSVRNDCVVNYYALIPQSSYRTFTIYGSKTKTYSVISYCGTNKIQVTTSNGSVTIK